MGQNSNTLGDPMGSSALGMAQSELILGSIRDAVVMTDLSGIVTYWNAAATKLFGWSADEVLGRHYAERYPAERREWISAQIIERVNGSDWDGEYADLRKDGSVVWIRALVRRIFGPDGKLAGILGVSQDISQEKQAQRTAQAQAALERAVLDSMPAHIAVLDARGTIRAVNRAWREFANQNAPLGLETTPHTGIGVNYLGVMQPCEDGETTDWDEVRRAIVDVLAGRRRSFSLEYPCHSPNQKHWFRMTVTPLEHADGGAVVAHTEITERVVSELRSRQDSERLQLALAAARMGVWSLELRSGELSYSPEVQQILRRAHFEADAKDLCSLIHPDDNAAMNLKVARCIAQRGHFQGTFRIVRADGQECWLHNFAEAQLRSDGEVERVVGTLQDVTALRAARMTTLRTNQILGQIAQGAELTAVLSKIACALQEQFHGMRCAVLLFDPLRGSLRLGAAPSMPSDVQAVLENLSSTVLGDLFSGTSQDLPCIQVRDFAAEPLSGSCATLAAIHGLRAILSLPLMSGDAAKADGLLGFFIVLAAGGREPDEAFSALVEASRSLLVAGPQPRLSELPEEEEAIASGSARSVSKSLANAMYLAALAIARQRALSDLQASEERFRLLVDGMSDHAVYLVDLEQRVCTWNAAAARMFGYSGSEIIQQPVRRLLRAEDQAAGLVESSLRQIATEKRLEVEGWWVRADGSHFWGTTVVNALFEKDGSVRGYVVVTRDLTERRRLEEQLRQAQRMDAIGRLAGGVAHEFNNLLMIINGYADLLSSLLAKNDIQTEAMLAIRDAGERAAALTRQLLAFSSTAIVAPRMLDLNEIITSARRILRRLLGDDIRLITQLDPRLGSIKIDPGQLDQLLMNLAMHARAAMPQGGTLQIQTAAIALESTRQMDFGSLQPGRYAQLAIRDSGRGVNEESRLHLFEPFFNHEDQRGGTGLGLATVYGIVRQAGGAIEVESAPSKGTEFRILFPMLSTALNHAAQQPSALPQGSETLLIVEEEDAIRQIVRITLQMIGYQVLAAASYGEALAVAAKHSARIHALLGDAAPQPADAPALADVLRAAQPQLKVLYLSTQTMPSRARSGVDASSVAVLPKPFTPHALASKLRELLDRE